ncbi:Wzz/FepE/Etk N-terminal domain-containing protein [Paenibacillus sp. FSL H8-0548]|uniref:YveK family protein n=1 Tax=Paenibacillus sp. FSL H8-0548 TaxID=1920422 RepID=UPI0009F91450|nr:Wzz/FepE/Etk N-terminal domain-containing protein [Paenibacillus sp. FSL H8-0548]
MEGSRGEELQTIRSEKESRMVKEINLKALYVTIRKRVWMVLLITISLTILAGLYNSRPETPMYSSSARVIIATTADMMGTVRVLFREPIVMNEVIEALQLNRSAAQLRSQFRVDSVDGTLVTVISVVDSDSKLAADIVNTAVDAYKKAAAQILGITNIQVLTTAQENPNSINEKSNTIVFVGFILGLILSLAFIFLLDSLDDSIKSDRQIEDVLGLTVLGDVSQMKKKDYARHLKKQKSILVRGETIGS